MAFYKFTFHMRIALTYLCIKQSYMKPRSSFSPIATMTDITAFTVRDPFLFHRNEYPPVMKIKKADTPFQHAYPPATQSPPPHPSPSTHSTTSPTPSQPSSPSTNPTPSSQHQPNPPKHPTQPKAQKPQSQNCQQQKTRRKNLIMRNHNRSQPSIQTLPRRHILPFHLCANRARDPRQQNVCV